MSQVTRILSAIEEGDPRAAERLLPLVYDELRKLASARMAQEKPGQTLQATALVHEAYVRLVDTDKVQHWNSRGHFFAAAAEAMRRILIETARRKQSPIYGGAFARQELDAVDLATVDMLHPEGNKSEWPQTGGNRPLDLTEPQHRRHDHTQQPARVERQTPPPGPFPEGGV